MPKTKNKMLSDGSRGFTLIELMVVISILTLIAAALIFAVQKARINAREVARRENLRQLQKALELYYSDNNGTYPSTCNPVSPCALHWYGESTRVRLIFNRS